MKTPFGISAKNRGFSITEIYGLEAMNTDER
jgi:hypothetical protein